MRDSTDLKPCPFCGGEASFRLNLGRAGGYPWFVRCSKCEVSTEGTAFENDEHNASVWNTRTHNAKVTISDADLLGNTPEKEQK